MAMEFRRLGRTDLRVSEIGLGTEHLERSRANMESVVRTAVEAGVNYMDVLYADPDGSADFWDSFGPALRRYRERIVLAAHWGHSTDADQSQRGLERVFSLVGNEYIDVVIIQVIDHEEQWREIGLRAVDRLMRYKEQGRIGHIGMSGHFVPTALTALNSGLIDVLMYGINFVTCADGEIKKIYRACEAHDVGLVAMKPYYGGTLLFTRGRQPRIPSATCLSFVLSQPVSTTVPGAKNTDEFRTTLHYLEATEEEKSYGDIGDIRHHLSGQCVYCQHCHPCTQEIHIAGVIALVDQAQGGLEEEAGAAYSGQGVKASECTACGVCMERCPFGVDVIGKMETAVTLFE